MQNFTLENTKKEKVYTYILLLAMFYVALDISSNVVVYKVVNMGFLIEPGSAFIFPLTYVISDVVADVYGYAVARNMIWFSVVCGVLSTILILLVIHAPSPIHSSNNQKDFIYVLGNTWRVSLGGYVAKLIGSFINIYIISRLKIMFKGKMFALRSITASAVGELIYIIIAGTVVWYGTFGFSETVHLIINDYLMKLFFLLVFAVPAGFLAQWLRKKENIKITYDTKFSPFKLK